MQNYEIDKPWFLKIQQLYVAIIQKNRGHIKKYFLSYFIRNCKSKSFNLKITLSLSHTTIK